MMVLPLSVQEIDAYPCFPRTLVDEGGSPVSWYAKIKDGFSILDFVSGVNYYNGLSFTNADVGFEWWRFRPAAPGARDNYDGWTSTQMPGKKGKRGSFEVMVISERGF